MVADGFWQNHVRLMNQNKKIKCPVCKIRSAIIDKQYGSLPCLFCRRRQNKIAVPYKSVEWTSQNIKEGRREYGKSILQPWREGVPSLEYQQAYPEQSKKMFAKYKKSEIKNVWGDVLPNWERSK